MAIPTMTAPTMAALTTRRQEAVSMLPPLLLRIGPGHAPTLTLILTLILTLTLTLTLTRRVPTTSSAWLTYCAWCGCYDP